MKYARLLIAAIIAHILWTPDASAQTTRRHDVSGRYQQLKWDERDGLPQNTVLAIAMTRDGYLRLGTYEGAARFDLHAACTPRSSGSAEKRTRETNAKDRNV